jgi:hypothetical protein
VDKVKTPASPALVFGSAFHDAVERLIRLNWSGDAVHLPTIWTESWAKANRQEVDWNTELPEQVETEGLKLLMYAECQQDLCLLRPLEVDGKPAIEEFVELRVPGVPIPIIGYVDLITDDHVPCDFKTSARAWSDDKAAKEIQPLFYLAALNQQRGWPLSDPGCFRHIVFVKHQRLPKMQIIRTERTVSEVLWVMEMIRLVWEGISKEVYSPNPGTWRCSEKWCEYWGLCQR